MARTRYVKTLANHPLLKECSRKELTMLSKHATPLRVSKGKLLMSGRRPAREFFMLESGRASVSVEGRQVAELGNGDFCGEMSLLDDNYIRRAEVVAETDMDILVFDSRGFRQMMQEVPLAAERIRDVVKFRQN
jgi:CRP/FNR family cyclic AMP-dependent transcriptional regulator